MDSKLKAIFLGLATVVLLSGAAHAGMYFDSAHGNTDYGVLWTTGPIYTQGHCNHCHLTHDSVDGEPPVTANGPYHFALFYDDAKSATDLFCFVCHRNTDLGYGQVDNYPYFITFGGGGVSYQSIRDQFLSANSAWTNCGSKHHLGQIYNALKSSVGQGWGFNDDPDPCVACHPPHAAQRPYPPTTTGDLNTCIRRPSHYKSTAPNDILWGDDSDETMHHYATVRASPVGEYQPPYFGDFFNGKYEPTGTTTDYAGLRTPDYVTFCMDCHQYQLSDPERGGAVVKKIDWTKDRHGTALANTCDVPGWDGTLKPPYDDPEQDNYILSCLDCHEPHGSPNRSSLIRRIVNGRLTLADTGTCDRPEDYNELCLACHDYGHTGQTGCGCHNPGAMDSFASFHGNVFGAFCPDKPAF